MFETIDYRVAHGAAHVVLNRPDRHNALSGQLLVDLDAALDAAEDDDAVRAVILRGAGPSFCSGFDRDDSPYLTPPSGGWTMGVALDRLDVIEDRWLRLWRFPKPTVAQVHGHAIAAGCYLQLLCDIAVAADDARLGHPVSRGGVSSLPLWQVLLGARTARYLLMTGRTVSGREAVDLGLVTMAVPADALEETVAGIVADLVVPDPAAMRLQKANLTTDLELLGVGAMFRYHGQLNAMSRLERR